MSDDFEIDNILHKLTKKKKIKSGPKGKRAEREIVNILNERFREILSKHPDWGGFSRSIGSGNRFGQNVMLSKAALDTFTSDLACPTNFKFAVESKSGYNDVDLCSGFNNGVKQLDEFLRQVDGDATRTGKKALLLWKKDYKPRVAFVKANELPTLDYTYRMHYREWVAISFDELIKLDDEFFFGSV